MKNKNIVLIVVVLEMLTSERARDAKQFDVSLCSNIRIEQSVFISLREVGVSLIPDFNWNIVPSLGTYIPDGFSVGASGHEVIVS